MLAHRIPAWDELGNHYLGTVKKRPFSILEINIILACAHLGFMQLLEGGQRGLLKCRKVAAA